MHAAHQQLIETFYAAFARLDTDAMAACYAEDATFQDEAFKLRGKREVMGMWSMLCEAVRANGQDVWRLTWRDVTADEYGGHAHWDATYRFSATGRMVDNHIDASFGWSDAGLIAVHRDRFDFHAWARQALGTPGALLGWTPWLKAKVRAKAAASLRRHLERRP